jgi:hypothetical protein
MSYMSKMKVLRTSYVENQGTGRCMLVQNMECKEEIASRAGVSVWFQVFHTNVKKLSSRRRHQPIDHDLRCPMFVTSFDDPRKWTSWLGRNGDLLEACQISIVEPGCKHVSNMYMGKDQPRLHCFVAWLSYMLKLPKPHWVLGEVAELEQQVVADGFNQDGGAFVHLPGVLSPTDFQALAEGSKTLQEVTIRKIEEEVPVCMDPKTIARLVIENWQKEVLAADDSSIVH